MKKVYQNLSVRTVELAAERTILKGSITVIPIAMPATMVVKDFEDGFADDEFEINL